MNLLQKIFQEKYPRNHYLRYLNILSNIHQDDFITIKDYSNAITNVCENLQICMSWSDEQQLSKIEETFYHGLSKRTQLEMSRLIVQTVNEIYNMINCTEETLIEQLDSFENEYLMVNNLYSAKKPPKGRKHCEHHGSCNHYTSECRHLKERQRNTRLNKSNSENKNLIMQSTNKQPSLLKLNANIDDQRYIAILDSGSSFNYISEKLVEKHNLKKNNISPIKAGLVNGSIVVSSKDATFNFNFEGAKSQLYKVSAKVLPNMEPEIILGMEFLVANKAKIDLEKMVIELNGLEYQLADSENMNKIEEKLMNKTKIYCQLVKNLTSESLALLKHNISQIKNIGLV